MSQSSSKKRKQPESDCEREPDSESDYNIDEDGDDEEELVVTAEKVKGNTDRFNSVYLVSYPWLQASTNASLTPLIDR
jgi:hypothetical protein